MSKEKPTKGEVIGFSIFAGGILGFLIGLLANDKGIEMVPSIASGLVAGLFLGGFLTRDT